MPEIQPIPAVTFNPAAGEDISDRIAPPYDVLEPEDKHALLERSDHNIVAIDLPHLPAKTVGPDEAYEWAGGEYRRWLEEGVLHRHEPALFIYQQSYTVGGRTFQRRGLIANVPTQPFGPGPAGQGGVFPHEQTFPAAKEDRLKLMRATRAQLSPIFGLYSDPEKRVEALMGEVVERNPPALRGTTADDGVLHEAWPVTEGDLIQRFQQVLGPKDLFIADGHHRYTTALNYLEEQRGHGEPPAGATRCLFVLVSMQDEGMIVLPTHRVLGNMSDFDMARFTEAARGRLEIIPVEEHDLESLQRAVEQHPAAHAFGLYNPSAPGGTMAIAATVDDDPLQARFPEASEAWRNLDVAIVQHLIVEEVCQPNFCPEGEEVSWKFPHELEELERLAESNDYQLGLILRPTPLDSVRRVSEAGERMPQKSTFFYPKLATGMVINPLE